MSGGKRAGREVRAEGTRWTELGVGCAQEGFRDHAEPRQNLRGSRAGIPTVRGGQRPVLQGDRGEGVSVWVRRVRHLVLGGATVLALTGCGSEVSGQPSATTGSSASASSSGSIDAVDPCTLLKPQELQQLGLPTQSEPANGSGETGCTWINHSRFGLTLAKAKDGLAVSSSGCTTSF
ncbi:DUF3558 family protein [Gandjariella thermophila]|uniref:DUF3558 family protein n=1 Tax=Gandjariella thermophila TaxID=1931992 RepID=UPI0010FA301C